MKFTDGFWVLKPGYQLFHCTQVQDARWEGNAYVIYCSHIKLADRGSTLNAPLFTLTFRVLRDGILAVKMEHFQGSARKEPLFKLEHDESQLTAEESEDKITLHCGSISAVITRKEYSLAFFENGERLTGAGNRHMSYAKTPSGPYIRIKLDVDAGEKLYGLGERFTPFVKNGQVVDMWNEDGGTASELAYKNIPFYLSNKGYGVFVNSPDKVSYELCSEAVQSAQFSLPGEKLEFAIIGGGTLKKALMNYTALTGRPALPPAWSFGLWLTTSFTTEYNEQTINEFVDGMMEREIPLHVFHFDCFWMEAYEWSSLTWDRRMFPDPEGLLKRLKTKGLKICLWINPYIAQKSPLFREGMQGGYLLKRPNGDVWQWDMWQAGMGLVDFTNPDACAWYQNKLKALLDMGVDSFKTDFGERIPTDCVYHDRSDPQMMHNYYTLLYNQCVFELLEREKGEGEACVFARSATVGGQKFPVHWGGDSSSNYPSMAESMRAGLSLGMSGFGFWSHDISGFEDTASPDVYMRWAQFGLLSSHSRLHGSTSYRVPWLFGEQSPQVVRFFTNLKCRLMPYLYAAAVEAHRTGLPMMRAMVLEFFGDRACEDIDLQYMLGESLLVAPIFRKDGMVEYYLPKGKWTHLLSGEVAQGGAWRKGTYDMLSLPLFVRENTLLPLGANETQVDYDYLDGLELRIYQPQEGKSIDTVVVDSKGAVRLCMKAVRLENSVHLAVDGEHKGIKAVIYDGTDVRESFVQPGVQAIVT